LRRTAERTTAEPRSADVGAAHGEIEREEFFFADKEILRQYPPETQEIKRS
jgi:hypothetical protein